MLRAVVLLLAPGGVVAAAIPNVRHFTVSLPLVLRGRWTYTYEGITARTQLRFFTRETVEELFASTGYVVDRVEMLNGPWDGNPRWRRWKRPTRLAHNLLCQHYGVVAAPAEGPAVLRHRAEDERPLVAPAGRVEPACPPRPPLHLPRRPR